MAAAHDCNDLIKRELFFSLRRQIRDDRVSFTVNKTLNKLDCMEFGSETKYFV